MLYFKNHTAFMLINAQGSGDDLIPVDQHAGAIIVDVSTDDSNTSISTVETIEQPDIHTGFGGSITVTTTVSSKDINTNIAVNPSVSDKIVNIITETDEDGGVDGVYTTVITSTITTDEVLDVTFFCNTLLNKAEKLTEPDYRYIILRHDVVDGILHGNPGNDPAITCQEMYSLMNMVCVKMSEGMYQTLRQNWAGVEVIEITADEAFYGTTFFGEIRKVAKLWEAKTPWYGEKTPTNITPEIVGYILKVMKIFAVEIVEAEFERRWLTMRNASPIEVESWRIQAEEAKEWLEYKGSEGHVTPFLDYLASEKQLDKTELATKILEKSEQYQDNLSTMLVNMQKIIKQFKECASVWDINILYEDYFGIGMPLKQALELNRCIDGETYERKPEWRIKGNGLYF